MKKLFHEYCIEISDCATPGKWEPKFVCGDEAKYDYPHSQINLNSTKAWPLGPKSRCSNQAMLDAKFIAASRTLLPECARRLARAIEELRYIVENYTSSLSKSYYDGLIRDLEASLRKEE